MIEVLDDVWLRILQKRISSLKYHTSALSSYAKLLEQAIRPLSISFPRYLPRRAQYQSQIKRISRCPLYIVAARSPAARVKNDELFDVYVERRAHAPLEKKREHEIRKSNSDVVKDGNEDVTTGRSRGFVEYKRRERAASERRGKEGGRSTTDEKKNERERETESGARGKRERKDERRWEEKQRNNGLSAAGMRDERARARAAAS